MGGAVGLVGSRSMKRTLSFEPTPGPNDGEATERDHGQASQPKLRMANGTLCQ